MALLKRLVNQIGLIKSKMVRWLNKPKWLNRLTLYAIILSFVITAIRAIFLHCGFMHTSADSARYMLSALVQGEAAIIAMVITLSLVAMQLAASSYSARVIEEFRKTPDLWILIVVYGIAIFYGLGVLKLIEGACPAAGSMSNLEAHISCAYYFGIFAFVALIPYILNTLNLLKSSTIINMLAERITKKNILDVIGEEGEKTGDEDPVQPIVDIVCGAMMRYDYTTMRDGLMGIGDRADHIFKNDKFKDGGGAEKIAKHVFDHLTDIGGIAASRSDEKSTVEVIDNLGKSGITLVELRYIVATHQAMEHLLMIGVTAAEKELDNAAKEAAAAIGRIGAFAAGVSERKMSGVTNGAKQHLEVILNISLELELECTPRAANAAIILINEIVKKQGKS